MVLLIKRCRLINVVLLYGLEQPGRQKEILLGEDSSRQFKEKIDKADKLAKEMCAMSNSKGGIIYIGIKDDSTIVGITGRR